MVESGFTGRGAGIPGEWDQDVCGEFGERRIEFILKIVLVNEFAVLRELLRVSQIHRPVKTT